MRVTVTNSLVASYQAFLEAGILNITNSPKTSYNN